MNYGAGSSSGGAGFQQPKLFSSALGQDDNLPEERERFADAAKFSSARAQTLAFVWRRPRAPICSQSL